MPRPKKVIETETSAPEPLMPQSVVQRTQSKSMFSYVPWILIVLVILAAGFFIYSKQQQAKSLQQELSELKQNPQKITEEETKALLDKVGQLVELPDEQPSIATVTDLKPLADQEFFTNAQIDDKVLIYTSSKKAILYRPSTNKIIEIAPVNISGGSTSAESEQSQFAIKVLNASGTPGLARRVADKLTATGYKNVTVGDAGEVQTNTAISYESKLGSEASKINQIINNQATAEAGSDAGIIITLGSDFE